MNEIQTTVIDTLTVEILILKQQTAQNIIEIGKRLVSAKQGLPHGEWGKYLKEKVDFSQVTANKFMKISEEYSNLKAPLSLGSEKLWLLLEVPEKEREAFVQENDIENISTRELQKVIKERDEALRTLESAKKIAIEKSEEAKKSLDEKFKAESELRTSREVIIGAQNDYKALEAALAKEKENLKKEKENQKEEIAKLQSFIGEAKVSGNSEEVERLQASLQELQNDVDSSALKIDELEAQLKEKPVDVTETIIEKVPDEIMKELEERRKNDGKANNPLMTKFRGNHAALNLIFKNQLEVMAEIKETDHETYEKCKNAILDLTNKMSERL